MFNIEVVGIQEKNFEALRVEKLHVGHKLSRGLQRLRVGVVANRDRRYRTGLVYRRCRNLGHYV